jgi:CheY-like chemotaxis protein
MAPLTILVVEDHADSAQAMGRLLQHEGHRVTMARGFADALAAAARMGPIDVLVCDIALPDGNGCELLRVLRDRSAGAPGHAIALTGHTDGHWIEESRRASFHRFLLKPVLFEDLRAAVRPRSAVAPLAAGAPPDGLPAVE